MSNAMHNVVKYRREVLLGVFLAIISIPFVNLFPKEKQTDLWAILLAVIASDYIGFGIMDGRMKQKLIEIGLSSGFVILSILGLWYSTWFLVVGYIGHGIWDYIHDNQTVMTRMKPWYPSFCMIYDWIIGIWLAYEALYNENTISF